MKFKTSITEIKGGKEFVRGHDLQELAKKNTFTQAIYLLLKGSIPSKKEEQMLNTLLTVAIDHGPATTSAFVGRIVASADNSMHTSVAAGLLTMGRRHGSATAYAMEFLYDHVEAEDVPALVAKLKQEKYRIPGFGHALLVHDHRSDTIFDVARETGFFGRHCEFINVVHNELNKISSKKLPLNVDGAMAAVLCDMGFDARLAKGIFMIARMPGLVAQVFEEMENDVGIRRPSNEDVEFVG